MQRLLLLLPVAISLAASAANAVEPQDEGSVERLQREVQPILSEYCYGCHGDGANEGSVSLDSLFNLADENERKATWYRALRQLRADLMPPRNESQPSAQEQKVLDDWIKYQALELDAAHPDPGRVTIRRLNRTEYQNTIRDLLGIDFDAQSYFPADDTGHGFDNIGDVLSMSPLLFEKYVDAANEIVSRVVPTSSAIMRELVLPGSGFQLDPKESADEPQSEAGGPRGRFPPGFGLGRRSEGGTPDENGPLELSYYEEQTARAAVNLDYAGKYAVVLKLTAAESYVDNVFDLNKCEFTFSLDGRNLLNREFVRLGGKQFEFKFDRQLQEGSHDIVLAIKPLSDVEQVRRLRLEIESVNFIGPDAPETFVQPERYATVFPRSVPADAADRLEYAKELLGQFARRAFRRPVGESTVDKLAGLAEQVYSSGGTFEAGISKAMTAILASPRFLFREEFAMDSSQDPNSAASASPVDFDYPLIDEYSLASRLSYFLWSSTPDEELLRLADEGRLRANLQAQISRMLADQRSGELYSNFTGQWLRSREIESVQISARSVLRREATPDPEGDRRRQRFFELFRKAEDERTEEEAAEFEQLRETFRSSFRRGPGIDLTDSIRRAMRRETEMLVEHIFRDDRSVLEILDCDYSFLNEELAGFYEIEGVAGREMQKVTLPAGSPRGGVLTHGTFLAVTSNPDRTSPVKRGLFVLENLLGLSTGAPPPNVPPLEEAAEADEVEKLSLRETLALHRQNELCSSCHNRMDPLGLALENFNAMGRYRERELGESIDVSGTLLTGEAFSNVNELKSILATSRKLDFYYCLTEKLMTYALGRAIDYQDLITLDAIVQELDSNEGRASALLNGVIDSAAFQRTRTLRNNKN